MINSKDFIAQKNRDSISFAITCGFYIVLFILFAVIPISKPKKYTQISVQLDSLPQKKIEKPVVPVEKEIVQKESVPKVEQKPVEKQIEQKKEVAKTTSQVKPATKTQPQSQNQPKTQTTQSQSTTQTKSQPATVKKEVVYQKSVEELMAENAKKKKQTATWDDSIFNDEATTSSSVTENVGTFQENAVSSLEGIAASSSQSSNVQTSSVARGESSNQGQVSDSTSNALNKISEAKYVTNNSSQTISYETSGILQPRQLIFPSEPSITIPETLENKIVRNRTVKISFIVKSDGSVDVRSIQIEPVGSLVTEIETEIKKQIALWHFESGKSDGQAAFNYSIKVE
ncbi:MAG: hypothetical protein IJD23_04235 [Spirochaetaceae bacterium]|nr:hypothetical protein [Spirochaetaceae bacterium]